MLINVVFSILHCTHCHDWPSGLSCEPVVLDAMPMFNLLCVVCLASSIVVHCVDFYIPFCSVAVQVLEKLCIDHPHHSLYVILALRNADAGTAKAAVSAQPPPAKRLKRQTSSQPAVVDDVGTVRCIHVLPCI